MNPSAITSNHSENGTFFETRVPLGKENAPWVVLIHGLGLNHKMWQWQADAVCQNFRLLTYDLTGSGQSAPPRHTPSLTLFADQLAELMDELEIHRAAIAGFSLGGMIARRFAMDYSDRLWALAILNSAYKRDPEAHEAIQKRVYQAEEHGPQATVGAALERWFGEVFRQNSPEIMEMVRSAILANDPTIYPKNYQVLVDGVDELVKPEPAIDSPTLVMTAEQDYGNSVEMTHAIAREIPGAKTVILPKLRHMAMVEDPLLFNAELMDFLTSIKNGGHDE